MPDHVVPEHDVATRHTRGNCNAVTAITTGTRVIQVGDVIFLDGAVNGSRGKPDTTVIRAACTIKITDPVL